MSIVIFVHVLFGTLAVLSGFIAISAGKGNRRHKAAGKVYVLTMIVMAVAGALAAFLLSQVINLFAAGLTCYLVLTAWHAAKHPIIKKDRFSVIANLFILLISISALSVGYTAMQSADGAYQSYHYAAYFFIGGVSGLAAVLDAYLLIKGNLNTRQRLIRHIWRMTFSYFIAVGSLFTGPGASAFPDVIRESGVLSIPEPLVLLVMLYWIGKTFWDGRAKKQPR